MRKCLRCRDKNWCYCSKCVRVCKCNGITEWCYKFKGRKENGGNVSNKQANEVSKECN